MFGSVMGGVWAANLTVNMWNFAAGGSVIDFDELDRSPGIGIVNIVFIGIDDHGLADALMLVSVNGIDNTVNTLSIPRDMRISFGTRFGKVNEIYAAGLQDVRRGNITEPEEYVIRRVREFTGLPVHYFVTMQMDGFADIIDILGGVEIDVPNIGGRGGMFYNDPTPGGARINLTAGVQTLNGRDSLGFVRFRTYPDGDLGRIRAQQQFIEAFTAQHVTWQNLPNLADVFNEIYENIRTNFTAADLLRYGALLRDIDGENIQTFQVPGVPAYVGAISFFVPNLGQLETLVNDYFTLRIDTENIDAEYE